ncbi:hypothetical protein BDB00DRAFT_522916 [Zychaea mexicana]|uniref:uncharacterized protein n=1 Tax=Zychaea mexicana TaxID=64656 RepID=UPI0022FE6C8B|nr:uncharacterized protein BDB00DRAFT_522916 [Zychaea mexicana]KAI9491008.1 hypothetical protein BDB00DRAFT_522916 [Zychaea mexicana]
MVMLYISFVQTISINYLPDKRYICIYIQGHNRTQNLSDQKKSALAKVQKCLDAYNIVARNHSVIGLSPFDNSVSSLLAKNSKFRKHANLLSTMGDDLPYDALHGYLRAQEELKMLREEAMSVLKYGKELVHKLTEATKGPELFDNLSDEVLGMAVICKQKLVEAERWNVDQKRRLTRIAAGLHSVASSVYSAQTTSTIMRLTRSLLYGEQNLKTTVLYICPKHNWIKWCIGRHIYNNNTKAYRPTIIH